MHACRQAALVVLLALGSTAVCAQTTPAREQELLSAAQHEPGNVRAAAALGEYYFHEKRWTASAQWLGKAYALSQSDAAIGYDLALAWMNAGALDKAKAQVNALQQSQDSAKLHSLMAEIDDRSGADRDAALEYHRAAELEPTEDHIFDLATYLLQHKQYVGALDDAIKFYRYGVEKYPRSARMRVGLGVALYAASNYDDAVKVLCEAVDLDPKDTRPLQFLGRASRVSPALAPDVDARLKDFAMRYPENAAADYFYALALWERGGGEQGQHVDEIEQLLRKAERIDPKWYEPHYQLGVVYESQSRYADALAEMKRAAAIDPEYFPAHYRLAMLYQRAGLHAEAQKEAALVQRLKAKDADGGSRHDVTE